MFVSSLFALGVAFPQATASCVDDVASRLLRAITTQNREQLIRIANNASIDSVDIDYLTGDKHGEFPGTPGYKSAFQVLSRQKVLTKVVSTELADGSRRIEIVYLPLRTAKTFAALERLISRGQAKPFRDYVICEMIERNGKTYLPNACLAESDALE